MNDDTEQRRKIAELKQKARDYQVDGVFTDEPGRGLSLKQAAYMAWEEGLIPLPTIEALLERLEKSLEKYRPEDQ